MIRANRFDVVLINLDPRMGGETGGEIQKPRPCLVLSPDEMNRHLRTVIIAPMTTKIRDYPTRITCTFQRVEGQIVLDQIRAVDKDRLTKKLGHLDETIQDQTLSTLGEMFAK
jgi:mRNA interferase MazF